MDTVQHSRGWLLKDVVLSHGVDDTFHETAIKDPSIVYFENSWHIFYTARGKGRYSIGYSSSPSLSQFANAERHQLKLSVDVSRIDCAPQIFYFTPHKLWYLIFQTTEANYQPAFSTNSSLANPNNWTKSQNLVQKDTSEKWIDFWVICDDTHAYLFYTQEHNEVFVRTTKLENFPSQWGDAIKVFSGVHEAVHVYSVPAENRFIMVYEISTDGVRSFGLATAAHLTGPWKDTGHEFASGSMLIPGHVRNIWTEMVSHGEAIRSGYNEKFEVESENGEWIIQGMMKHDMNKEYAELPWKIGLISRYI